MEQWKEIEGFKVSNLGGIESKLYLNNNGYLTTTKGGQGLHILIAKAFCNWFEGCHAHHINFNKLDNRASNIICLTASEHMKLHSLFRENKPHTEEHKRKIKENSHSKKVAEYDLDGNLIKIWNCMNDAGKFYNCTTSHICAVCKGQRKTAAKRIWRYIDDSI